MKITGAGAIYAMRPDMQRQVVSHKAGNDLPFVMDAFKRREWAARAILRA